MQEIGLVITESPVSVVDLADITDLLPMLGRRR